MSQTLTTAFHPERIDELMAREQFGLIEPRTDPFPSPCVVRFVAATVPFVLASGALAIYYQKGAAQSTCLGATALTLIVSSPIWIWNKDLGEHFGKQLSTNEIVWRSYVNSIPDGDCFPSFSQSALEAAPPPLDFLEALHERLDATFNSWSAMPPGSQKKHVQFALAWMRMHYNNLRRQFERSADAQTRLTEDDNSTVMQDWLRAQQIDSRIDGYRHLFYLAAMMELLHYDGEARSPSQIFLDREAHISAIDALVERWVVELQETGFNPRAG